MTALEPLTFGNGEFDLTFQPDGNGGYKIPASPVARQLGFATARDMLRTLPDTHKGWELVPTPGDHRGLQLWSMPGDLVLSPFAGIGSEWWEAIRMGRQFVGVELKGSYFREACRNLAAAVMERDSGTLFDAEALA